MRKTFVLVSLLLALSMLLAACGSPATSTTAPSTGETQAPAATEAPAVGCSDNPYVGSGQLDGNGIPCDFFADVNIRKAFSYAFDFDTYISDVWHGEAVQSLELSLPGMVGYDTSAPHYTFDLDKATAAFQAASDDPNSPAAGVMDKGFRVQMLYNQGNDARKTIAEILAADLSQINDKFQVEILGLPWPAYLAAQRAGQIPIMTGGWLEDIHDPSNWYQPYTVGAYGGRQNMPSDLQAQFQPLLDQGVSASGDARADPYHQINQLYYDTAPGLPLVLSTSHTYEQRWVQGVVRNPIFPGFYFRTITKAAGAKNPTTFTYATFGDVDTLDPALAYDTASGEVIQNIYDTLVFYDGDKPGTFVPQLASEMPTVSDDGKTYTFKLRDGVTFSNGDPLTASDVAYSFTRGLLQGGGVSPQWLLSEPFFGVGNQDVAMMVDSSGALVDDPEGLQAADANTLKSVCENLKQQIVADDSANTVTFTLAQSWGPFLATIAQTWGSVMDAKWVADNGGWDGSCDTWQKFYGIQSSDDPLSKIAMGTGPYVLDHWTAGTEVVLTANPSYWGDAPAMQRVVIQEIDEWGTRFSELQTGDADIATVPVANRPQADAMVGEMSIYNSDTGSYDDPQPVCGYDSSKMASAAFTVCGAGQAAPSMADRPLRVYLGQPGLLMDVILYNFDIK